MIQVERVTRFFTGIAPELLDKTLKYLARNRSFQNLLIKSEQKKLIGLNHPEKFLVVPDINIGDALILQSFILSVKDYFHHSQVHYIYHRKAFPLIKNNPYITEHFPFFRGKGIPVENDIQNLVKILHRNHYDLIVNFCPYFPPKLFNSSQARVIHSLRFMSEIIKGYAENKRKAHIAYHAGQYAAELAGEISANNHSENKSSRYNTFFFADRDLIHPTEAAVQKLGIDPGKTTILFNPDSASLFTFIPFALQLKLLKGILSMEPAEQLLVNCGRTFKDIEKSILNSLPGELKRKIIIIPENIPIDVYAAISDLAEMFISGDTGPMHIAAARKILIGSPDYFNNSTALVGIFGATSSKIYGYDSFLSDHLSPPQNAPAKVFEGNPSCKNLTCTDKIYKRCKQVRCFEGLDCFEILHYIESYLRFQKTGSQPISAAFNPFKNIKNHRNPEEKKG